MSERARPNLLYIHSDQHNAAVAGCYGDQHVHTPHLDRLAGAGALFTSNYCCSPDLRPLAHGHAHRSPPLAERSLDQQSRAQFRHTHAGAQHGRRRLPPRADRAHAFGRPGPAARLLRAPGRRPFAQLPPPSRMSVPSWASCTARRVPTASASSGPGPGSPATRYMTRPSRRPPWTGLIASACSAAPAWTTRPFRSAWASCCRIRPTWRAAPTMNVTAPQPAAATQAARI